MWRSGPDPAYGEIGGLTRKFERVKLVNSEVVGDSGARFGKVCGLITPTFYHPRAR